MIDILLFAGFREAVGVEKLQWEKTSATVSEVKHFLQTAYVHLPSMDHVMVAVNEEYAFEDTTIQAGDTVAIIPPVSGG